MKIKISISLILLTLFCSVFVFSHENPTNSEELMIEFIRLENFPSCPNGTYEKGWHINSHFL